MIFINHGYIGSSWKLHESLSVNINNIFARNIQLAEIINVLLHRK